MALVSIPPTAARVTWDRRRARPASVTWDGRRVRVVALAARREELAAFPIGHGPRVTYLVETDGAGRASLVFDARAGRWYLDALEAA